MNVMVLTVEEFLARIDNTLHEGYGPVTGASPAEELPEWERELLAEDAEAAALNGPICAGDRVGVAVHGGGMRVGEILSIRHDRSYTGDIKRTEVKVRVDWSSGFHWGRGGRPALPFIRTYERPERMVRL